MIPDVEQEKNWTGRGHPRSLETDKIFLVMEVELKLKTVRPKSVLGPMRELAKIALASFSRC